MPPTNAAEDAAGDRLDRAYELDVAGGLEDMRAGALGGCGYR
jgi:hypothetical protein